MTTYAVDPQASEGLRKCMHILERMHYVWPAAWRANELLQGVKVQPSQNVSPKVSTPERSKRLAESMDEDQRRSSLESGSATSQNGGEQLAQSPQQHLVHQHAG